MADTPEATGLRGWFTSINEGFGLLRRAAVEVEEVPATREDSNDLNLPDASSVAVAVVESPKNGNDGQISTTPQASVVNTTPIPHNGSMGKKKRAVQAPKQAPKKKKKKTTSVDPSDDPPVPKMSNPLGMEEAFDKGYDSDGWEGPMRGTDPSELEELEEKEIEDVEEQGQENTADAITEPTFVDISDAAIMKLSVNQLKHELKIRKVVLPKDKRKPSLRNRLKEAIQKKTLVHPNVTGKPEEEDDMADFAVGAKWVVLTPDVDVEEPTNPGFPGARPPTRSEDDAKVQPRPKKQFSREFDRPPCVNGPEKGGPKKEFLKEHGLDANSLPAEFADAFFPMHENPELDENGDHMWSMQCLAQNLNLRANLAFAGEATYEEWSGDFSIKEVRQCLGLCMMHGLSPSPGVEKKFDTNDKANFNAFVTNNLGTNPARRLRQFKAFLSCQDPRKPTPDRQRSPLFKALPLVKWMRRLGPLCWECGIDLSLDEQTLGFTGRHVDKMRTTHKAEGDGFQCDALCDDGFVYSVFFRNEPSPKKFLDQGCAHLHARSLWLFEQLERPCHRVWVDNLYMSARFAKAAHMLAIHVMLNGVGRPSGRGYNQHSLPSFTAAAPPYFLSLPLIDTSAFGR